MQLVTAETATPSADAAAAGLRQRVVVTGAGAVSALGVGCAALWAAVSEGRDGITTIERFPTDQYSVRLGALVPSQNRRMPSLQAQPLCLEYALLAAREALSQSGPSLAGGRRLGIVLGTSLGDTENRVHVIAELLARALNVTGPCITVSTACSSSANSLGLGIDLLREFAVDAVIAGGADILSDTVFAGFHALGVLNQEKCAPFGLPMGTTLGEGAGFLVLERADDAQRRAARVLGVLSGYGLSSDAYHATSPDPGGSGIARAIEAALRHAELTTADVGYVNAHGSGTAANDRAEWQAIQRVFGESANRLPVSSVKSHLGHAQGAAGVLELIVSLLAMQHDVVPPTLRCEQPRPYGPVDPVAQEKPRPARYAHAVCLSSAFGGANAAVVLSRESAGPTTAARAAIEIRGFAAVGAQGASLEEFEALLHGQPQASSMPTFDLSRVLPMADPRDLDDGGRYLALAGAQALTDAGLCIRGPTRDRAGLIVGTTSISARAGAAFQRSVDERGLHRCSTNAFAHMVLNAAAGAASRLLSLRGPTSTVTTGPGSGLVAIAYAASLLASRTDVDFLLAGGLDAMNRAETGGLDDGAGLLVLARGGVPSSKAEPAVHLAGWGLAAHGALEDAITRALLMARTTTSDLDLVLGPCGTSALARAQSGFERRANRALSGFGDAARSALACGAALLAIRRGYARRALVVAGDGQSASCAVILRGSE